MVFMGAAHAFDCEKSNEYLQFLARSAAATSQNIAIADEIEKVLMGQGMSLGEAIDVKVLSPKTLEQEGLNSLVRELHEKLLTIKATTIEGCVERIRLEDEMGDALVKFGEARLLMFKNRPLAQPLHQPP